MRFYNEFTKVAYYFETAKHYERKFATIFCSRKKTPKRTGFMYAYIGFF